MQAVDQLIHARWIVPVDEARRRLEDHALAIRDGRIVAVLPQAAARARYSATEVCELTDSLLIPGLVNAHTHAAMTLLRGFADDIPLHEWLNERIWPAEQRWVGPQFVRDGTRLAVAEMLRGGTTCFNDMYFFADDVAQVCTEAGIRACIGLIVIDFPTPWATSSAEYLEKALAVHDALRHNELIRTAFAPHSPYSVSDDPLKKIRILADELEVPIHIHLHETAHEVDESTARYGMRPLERLSQLGLLNTRLIAVHMTQLLDAEIDALAEQGLSVVHCPESNLKLASGLCPVSKLLDAGVNVALGTDGSASNNDLDMMAEMRIAALLAKGVSGDPESVPAWQALHMATLAGAQALGWADQIGSLEAGKRADVVSVKLGEAANTPIYDPVSQLVYTATRDQVRDVWIGGRRVVNDGKLETLDEDSILATARQWGARISKAPTKQHAAAAPGT